MVVADPFAQQLPKDLPMQRDEDPGLAAHTDLRLFRAVVEAVREAVVVTSPDLDVPGPVIEYVNPAFTQMTGYLADEVIGQTPRLLQGPDTERSVLDRLRTDLVRDQAFFGEAINYRKDGSTYIVEWLISPVQDERDQVIKWVAVQRDVSDRHASTALEALLRAELQDRVRNALAVIEALTRQTTGSRGENQPSGVRLESRIGAFNRTQSLATVDPSAGVALADLVRTQLAHAGAIGERVAVDGGPPVTISVKPAEMLGMALHELAANAVHHGALACDDGRLTVGWAIEAQPSGTSALVIDWSELGLIRCVDEIPKEGFGMNLLQRSLPSALRAEAALSFGADYWRCSIRIPIDGKAVLVD